MSVGVLIKREGCFAMRQIAGSGMGLRSVKGTDIIRVADGDRVEKMTGLQFEIALSEPGSWERETVVPLMNECGNVIPERR